MSKIPQIFTGSRICIICEGDEEYEYLEKLISLDVWSKEYLFQLENAEGNGNIPIQRLEDFRNNKKTEALGKITPEIKGKYSFGNLNNVLPEYVCKSISDAMEYFERKIEGFNDNDTIMSAVESRTSSPVRIIRDENYQSNVRGLIPAGEGAGYAGGITSAAIDGIKIFEFIGKNFHKPEDFC